MLNFNSFLKYSVFIGHSTLNSILLSTWFFFKVRKKIWIINIFKTILFLKLVLKFLKFLVSNNLPFWFIDLDIEKEFLVKNAALVCGEFSSTRIWIRGFLSNFKSIQKGFSKLLLKRDSLRAGYRKDLIMNWYQTRFTWPRGLFISNVVLNYIVSKEASQVQLPVVAMVDTNIKSFLFSYPIPSNDDALNSVSYILGIIAQNLLLLKYKKIIIWYSKYNLKTSKVIQQLSNCNVKKSGTFTILNSKQLSKQFSNLVIVKLFNNSIKFHKNMHKLLNIKLKGSFLLGLGYAGEEAFNKLSKSKLSAVKKLNSNNFFFKTFLKKNKYNMGGGALKVFSNTLKLKYLSLNLKKKSNNKKWLKKAKRNFYFNYFVMSTLIRKHRSFHESFIVNPSNNKSYFNDAAIVLNLNRWVSTIQRLRYKSRGQQVSNYWLYPLIRHFSIKDGYKWYQSKFFNKADNIFNTRFNWKLPKMLTPQTTLHFYNYWFLFLLNKNNNVSNK